jgi:hypothetical protein
LRKKTGEQTFIIEVGMKSTGEDFGVVLLIMLMTSSIVTIGRV